MNLTKGLSKILCATLFLLGAVYSQQVYGQSAGPAQTEKHEDEINLDIQLYLLVATNQDVDNAKLPSSLDQVVKQLHSSLPFKNYRLAATLINRVKNDGRLYLKWIGGPLSSAGSTSATNPNFSEFKVNNVKLLRNSANQSIIRMDGFGFSVRIPIVTASAIAANGPVTPVVNYETTGLNTDISMREGEAVIVGTLNIGPSGDAIILVMTSKSTNK